MDQTQAKPNTILIVDDTPENLTMLTQMLTKQGYQVAPAIDGRIALNAVRKAAPDLILLDIMMPGIDGYEVCRQLKADKQTRDIPVIFLSALGEAMNKVKAFSVGGVDYITKPFQVQEVLARVYTHLALRNVQKRLQTQNTQLQQEIAERKIIEVRLKTALSEREVLLQEIQHRTEASLNVICSMLKLQASMVTEEQTVQLFTDLETRIRVMALVHQKLYQTENLAQIDLKGYIYDLAILLYRTYKVNADLIMLKPKLESAIVSTDTAILCGLLLNELLSNCMRHAFPGGKQGEIRLELRTLETEEIELCIGDNGVGLPQDFDANKNGLFGLQLIRSIEQSHLQGTISQQTTPGKGTEWRVRFKEPDYRRK
jgi:two-component sensor histidine kinase